MVMRSVGFQLRTDGKAEVKNDFAEVRAAGATAFAGVAESAIDAGERAAQATERFSDRQIAAWKRQAAAAKLAAGAQDRRSTFDMALASRGSGSQFATVNLDRSTGAAKASADAFRPLIEAEEQLEARTRALLTAIDPTWAAQQRFNGTIAEAKALLDAGRISTDQFALAQERSHVQLDAATGATKRAEQARQALATMQARVNAAGDNGFGGWQGSAERSAEAFRGLIAEQEQLEARTRAFRASMDPAVAAQDRFNAEMVEARMLVSKGSIGLDEYCAKLKVERDQLDRTTEALNRQGAARFSQMQRQTLIYTASDVVGSLGSGASPGMIAMQQGPQVLQAFAAEEGGMAALKATLLGTTGAMIGLTAAAAAGVLAWASYSAAVTKLEAASRGAGVILGLNGDELERSAEAAANAGRLSVSAAREIETGYIGVARSGDVLVKMTAITRDYAAATGQDLAGAQRDLGAAFSDPIKGAEDLASRYGLLTQAQVERIAKLVEENDRVGAQRALLDALGPAFSGAADGGAALLTIWQQIGNAASDAFNAMGQALDRMAGGGTIAQQIADLERQRDQQQRGEAPSLWQFATLNGPANIDRQIAELREKARQEEARGRLARQNATRAEAAGIVDRYTGGEQLGALRADAGKIRAALRTNVSGADRDQLTETLGAYTRAIETFIPRQQRANELAAIDAKIAAAKSPAAKAALAAERTRIEMAGQVVTAAEVETQATARASQARSRAASAGNNHAASLAREAQAQEANAAAALTVADAYLKSAAAGVTAEAQRAAVTEATRKGISVEAQAKRDLARSVGDQLVTGAKSVAQLRDETTARASVRAQLLAGTISAGEMNQALSDEAALRPLLKLRTVAQGEALAVLNRVIRDYQAALADAHAEEARGAATSATKASRDRAIEIRAQIVDMNGDPFNQALNTARRAAEREADAARATGRERTDLVNARVDEAKANREGDLARYVADTRNAQQDRLALAARELQLLGANDNVRATELEKLRAQQEIRRRFPEMAAADVDAIVAGIGAIDEINARLKLTAASIDEARSFGTSFVETVLNKDTWSSWGNAGRTMTAMIRDEFIKLALLNPLKNLITGGNAPSFLSLIGSVAPGLAGLFGGGGWKGGITGPDSLVGTKSMLDFKPFDLPTLPRNATGTHSFSGGLTWVNEQGPEIADLPNGTRIYPAAETRRMLSAANDAGPNITIPISIDATGADAAGLARVEAQVAELKSSLPRTIIEVWSDAKSRRVVG